MKRFILAITAGSIVPEPGTALLLAVGGLLLVGRRRACNL